jgi:site-specific DNA-methyltransferase (adenine-specific)
MVLASSDEGDLVVDPFSGSGTTLRVCQQLKRRAIGIEINPDYVARTKDRLGMEFSGFDSVDPRMERVPFDLRRPGVRTEYLENHKQWFLQHHENAVEKFEDAVHVLYGSDEAQASRQMTLLEQHEEYLPNKRPNRTVAPRRRGPTSG